MDADNEGVALLEVVVVLCVVGLICYAVVGLLTRGLDRRRPAPGSAGRWRAAHYERNSETRIVVRKVAASGDIVDEHLVVAIPVGDANYDTRFLDGMAQARQRVALFEAEEDW